tara:strand:- start:216 stop:404 length:189 start_codon:yes stop_codon:yes gene_type:complete
MNTETLHKAGSTIMAAALLGLFKFYVDVKTELALLGQQVSQSNETADEILDILDTIAPRRTQ